MSGSKINADWQKKQPDPQKNQAYELEAKILNHMRMAVGYSDLAHQHYDLYDNFGFDRSVKEFIEHAKIVGNSIKKLRNLKGVTD
jgi:hypothetical protein